MASVISQKLPAPSEWGIVGVDEVGRGALAGPVVACAVLMPPDFDTEGIADSKVLSERERELAAERIRKSCRYGISFISQHRIDEINILQATFEAMREALSMLEETPLEVLVDGNQVPPNMGAPVRTIIKGDSKEACIAAASILAKVARDEFMKGQGMRYPEYGFGRHVGYASPEHLAAIEKFGPCDLHRMSFSPMRKDPQLCLALD